jgi:hypothetical protein
MIYIYVRGLGRPAVFADLTAAKQFVEEENCVDDTEQGMQDFGLVSMEH